MWSKLNRKVWLSEYICDWKKSIWRIDLLTDTVPVLTSSFVSVQEATNYNVRDRKKKYEHAYTQVEWTVYEHYDTYSIFLSKICLKGDRLLYMGSSNLFPPLSTWYSSFWKLYLNTHFLYWNSIKQSYNQYRRIFFLRFCLKMSDDEYTYILLLYFFFTTTVLTPKALFLWGRYNPRKTKISLSCSGVCEAGRALCPFPPKWKVPIDAWWWSFICQ